jgi:hypothetical protein
VVIFRFHGLFSVQEEDNLYNELKRSWLILKENPASIHRLSHMGLARNHTSCFLMIHFFILSSHLRLAVPRNSSFRLHALTLLEDGDWKFDVLKAANIQVLSLLNHGSLVW